MRHGTDNVSTSRECTVSHPYEKNLALPRSLLLDIYREDEFLFEAVACNPPPATREPGRGVDSLAIKQLEQATKMAQNGP